MLPGNATLLKDRSKQALQKQKMILFASFPKTFQNQYRLLHDLDIIDPQVTYKGIVSFMERIKRNEITERRQNFIEEEETQGEIHKVDADMVVLICVTQERFNHTKTKEILKVADF